MALPVVTVAAGGLPVVQLAGAGGLPMTEAANGRGIAVTKVTAFGLPVTFITEAGVIVPPVTPNVGFDPATTVNVALSNSNFTATHTNTVTNSGARVGVPKTSGKYYFEMKIVTVGSANVGLNAAANSYSPMLATGAGALFYATGTGNVNSSGTFVANIGVSSANDFAGIAVDIGAGLVWFRKNAGNWNGSGTANPATATGGASFVAGTSIAPCAAFGTAGSEIVILNTGGSAYANAAPSGFGNWPSS